MSRYLAIPYDALDRVVGDAERTLLVVLLYTEGHRRRWRPLRYTVRELAARVGCPKHVVESLLAALERDGLIEREVVVVGKRQEGTRIRVLDPVSRPDTDADTDADTGDEEEPPQSETRRTPPRTPPRTPITDQTLSLDPETSEKMSAGAGARDTSPRVDELALARLLAMQERDEPHHGMRQPRDLDALRRELARGTPESHLAALWDWSGVSEDALVSGSRVTNWRRWAGLLKRPLGPDRVAAAVAWHEAGRPGPAPPARAPRARKRFSILDLPDDDPLFTKEAHR